MLCVEQRLAGAEKGRGLREIERREGEQRQGHTETERHIDAFQ